MTSVLLRAKQSVSGIASYFKKTERHQVAVGASVGCPQTFAQTVAQGVLACEFSHRLGARTPASAGRGTPSALAAGDGYATIGDNQKMHPISCSHLSRGMTGDKPG